MVKEMQEIKLAIQSINKTLSEAKGGWRLLMAIGGAASVVTGIVGLIIGHWGSR